jgi:hypothetical protein
MPIPEQAVTGRRISVYVPAASVKNRRPAEVIVQARVLDGPTGAPVSNELTATIADFPHPKIAGAEADHGPFGWGEPLSVAPGGARELPRPGPDGFKFVRIPATENVPGLYLAATEATNAQVAKRLKGYDPKSGRSDEFTLEDPAQPAVGLTAKQAAAYLEALGKGDSSGVSYRLPTQAQWLKAARAGTTSAFWWGDEATHPAGANLLGPEPALAGDSTAPASGGGFEPNPWKLVHTFGNVAEWATTPSGGFVRLGGHFRTEPAVPLPEVAVQDAETTGPDPYVGVRPAFDLTAETGAALVRQALRGNELLADVKVAFDPDRATATLSGTLTEPALRRAADRRLEPLWFLAAVENRIVTPTVAAGQLALLGEVAGPPRRITPLGRRFYEVPVAVRWGDPLPVQGSDWYMNVYTPGGGHFAHKLVEGAPNNRGRVTVLVDPAKMAAAGLAADAPVSIALSLGAEAPSPADHQVVSNVAPLRWSLP